MKTTPPDNSNAPRNEKRSPRGSATSSTSSHASDKANAALCWPFPVGSQNDTDKAVKPEPQVPPKRRHFNQY
jgi:hypothetical protein